MQEIDIRYAFFLVPLLYVLIPFILSGTFFILGGVSLLALITGILMMVIISNLNFGGSANAFASGGSVNIGLNNEGGYQLFVIFIGGLFYLGATLTTIFTPLLNILVGVINTIVGFLGWATGISTSGITTSVISGLGGSSAINLNNVYPLGLTIQGISLFGILDAIFGSMFILGLYFMIASRGH